VCLSATKVLNFIVLQVPKTIVEFETQADRSAVDACAYTGIVDVDVDMFGGLALYMATSVLSKRGFAVESYAERRDQVVGWRWYLGCLTSGLS